MQKIVVFDDDFSIHNCDDGATTLATLNAICHMASGNVFDVAPKSVKQALNGPHKSQWLKAMQAEFQQHIDMRIGLSNHFR